MICLVCSESNWAMPLILAIVPTIGLIMLLVGIILFVGYLLSRRRAKHLMVGGIAGVSCGILFIALAVVAPLIINATGIGSGIPYCLPGEVAAHRGCGDWVCVASDPLAGQPCNVQNYTLCKYGCVSMGTLPRNEGICDSSPYRLGCFCQIGQGTDDCICAD